MASRPGSPTADVDTDTPESTAASFSQAETIHILDKLIVDPATYLSGNGLKTKTFTTLSKSLKNKFPTHPVRSTKTIANRIRYVKGIFEEYEFVRGKSGVGWDDEEKKATAEPEFIERFLEAQHAKYAKCFKQGCPYYDRLTRLFGGNKATGENVLHLKKPRATTSSSRSAATSSRSAAASSRSAAVSSRSAAASPSQTSPAPRKRHREPFADLENEVLDVHAGALPHVARDNSVPHSPKPHDDELLPPPANRARSTPTPIEIDSNADDETKKNPNQRDRLWRPSCFAYS
ncbi:hypothetical protein B0H19DRAFT_1377885 [Mycena capillaripes]|nr:hypothetical protein B0H19DRAFT_1377885 [Mycena capillaripes]